MAVVIFANINAQEKYLSLEQSPKKIKDFVTKHFPTNKISSVKQDKEFTKVEYEVKLDNGTELKFDKNFTVTDIESPIVLPNTVIPQKIREYVASKYPNAKVTDWEKERNKQKIELDNDLKLYFDLKGIFLRIDQ